MSLFWEHLFKYDFLQYALLGGLLASVACGIVGSFVVVRRSTYAVGAIAHSTLGGMGAAYYIQQTYGVSWMTPLLGATVAAVIVAIIVARVTLSGKQREDTVLSAVWAIGMAVGISFIHATQGYEQNLMSYLFGNLQMVSPSSIRHMVALDLVVVVVMLLFFDKFLVISFQPELARLRGIRVGMYHTLMLVIIALTVVLLSQVVGLVMVIALLILPAATTLLFTERLWVAMILAGGLCFGLIFAGFAISYEPDLRPGVTVIELAGVAYLLATFGKWVHGRFRNSHYKSAPAAPDENAAS